MSDEQHDLTDENFKSYGTVKLMDWWNAPGGQVINIRGTVRIVSDEDTVGFRARGANSANWLAVITGPTNTERWHIFGCQIRAIIEHASEVEFPDTYTVR